jgi:phage-related tail protein
VESATKAGRFAGQSSLDLRLTDLALGASLVPIMTGPYAQAGAKSIGKTAKGAAAGAAIGAIADGGDGAAKGAAIGAVASGLKKGEAVKVAPGTMLEFQLQQPLTVSVAR